jgi:hypothetical protein
MKIWIVTVHWDYDDDMMAGMRTRTMAASSEAKAKRLLLSTISEVSGCDTEIWDLRGNSNERGDVFGCLEVWGDNDDQIDYSILVRDVDSDK